MEELPIGAADERQKAGSTTLIEVRPYVEDDGGLVEFGLGGLTLLGMIYQLAEWQNRESALGSETVILLRKQPKLQ
jgi:hypothetical protein